MSAKPFTHTATGTVAEVIRHGHTVNGNPIMSIVLNEQVAPAVVIPVTYRISNDAGLVYGIENHEYRDTPHVFDVTGAGRISGYVRTVEQHKGRRS